jgi:hypothetical protein
MTIHNTSLVPYLIAGKVLNKYMEDNRIGMEQVTFERYSTFLEKKSERMFDTNESWRIHLLNSKDERQFLFNFMYHWLLAEVQRQKEPLLQLDMFHNVNLQLNLFA